MDSSNCNEKINQSRYELGNIDGIHVVIHTGDMVEQVAKMLPPGCGCDIRIDNVGYGYKVPVDLYYSSKVDTRKPIYFDDRFMGHRNLHLYIVKDTEDDVQDQPGPMMCSEMIRELQRLMSLHGDVMVAIPDTDGAARTYPVTAITFIPKTEAPLYQDRIEIE